MTDKQCPDGYSCQTYTAWNDKDLIKACTLAGVRKEGEPCAAFTRDLEEGCEHGLICHRRCGHPCEPGNPSTCPAGFFCEESRTGSACQPTCSGRTCPEGQRCISFGGNRSACAQVHGQDCQSTPCMTGQLCSVRDYPQAAHEVWMQCTQPCGMKGAGPCPAGTACNVFRCREACAPDGSSACEEGYKCKSLAGRPAICTPDLHDDQAVH